MKITQMKTQALFALAALFPLHYSLHAGVISVNFATGKNSSVNSLATENGDVGIEPVDASRWVNLQGKESASLIPTTLTDDLGNPTTARVTYRAGANWTPADTAPMLLRGYLDDSADGSPTINVTDIPYAAYDLIVYLATDGGPKFGPVRVNGTYYTCNDNGIGEPDPAGTSGWGSTATSKTAITLGQNAIRINGLSGALYPTLNLQGSRGQQTTTKPTIRGSIAGFQIVENTEVTPATAPQTISISFTRAADSIPNGTSPQGAVSVPSDQWHATPISTTITSGALAMLRLSDGPPSSAGVSWSASTTYQNDLYATGSISRGYLDDGNANLQTSVTVNEIPFSTYDVYLYFSGEKTRTANRPLIINGTTYRFNNYITIAGTPSWAFTPAPYDASPIEGKNYLVVRAVSGSTLNAKVALDGGGRGSIAAIQIVNTGAPATGTESYSRTVSENAAWHESAWVSSDGLTDRPWIDGANASITIASGKTLTLTAPASANSVAISGSGTLASNDADQTLTTEKISIASTNTEITTITSAISALGGGEFTLWANGIGSTGGAGTTGYTRFEPTALNASTLRIASGAVRTDLQTHSAALILDGGSLVDAGISSTIAQDIYIGPNQAHYRIHNNTSSTITGKISDAPSLTQPVGAFTRTDNGTLTLAADLTGYTGTFANNAGALILNATTRTAESNTILLTAGTVSYTIPEGDSATCPATFTGAGAPFTKDGPGALTLTGASTATSAFTVAGGILEFSETGRWGSNTAITINAGATLKTGTNFTPATTLTVSGTIEANITAKTLVLNAGSTVKSVNGKVLTANENFTATAPVAIELSAAPATGTTTTVLTLPSGITANLDAFRLTGFANASHYLIAQEGQNIIVRPPQGILISIY